MPTAVVVQVGAFLYETVTSLRDFRLSSMSVSSRVSRASSGHSTNGDKAGPKNESTSDGTVVQFHGPTPPILVAVTRVTKPVGGLSGNG